MKPELKAKWLEALRSGGYRQGKGFLQQIDNTTGAYTNCCLGVLCKVAGLPEAPSIPLHWATSFDGSKFSCTLNAHQMRQFEISEELCDKLAEMNDGDVHRCLEPKSFFEIADYIQENL